MEYNISVIMSVYREEEDWLRKSIESILHQSFADFEFIIINDNPERALNRRLLLEYQKKDARIKVIENPNNLGPAKARNKGLEIAQGNYIAVMDADDIALNHRLQTQFQFMEANPDYISCGADVYHIDEKGKRKSSFAMVFSDTQIRDVFPIRNPVFHPTLFFRSQGMRYDENLFYAQDYDLLRQLLQKGKVLNLREKLLNYRTSKHQITSTKFKKQHQNANTIRKQYICETFALNDDNLDTLSLYKKVKKLRSGKGDTPLLNNAIISLLANFEARASTTTLIQEAFRAKGTLKNRAKLLLRVLGLYNINTRG